MTDLSNCIVAPKYQLTYEQPPNKSLNQSAILQEEKKNTTNHSKLNISKMNARDLTVDLNSENISETHKLPLIEELELIGINRQDLQEIVNKNPKEKKLTVKPKMLYSFPGDVCDMSAKRVLPEFAFPFDVPAYKISNSASKINKYCFEINEEFFILQTQQT